jgi:hypothetical protein
MRRILLVLVASGVMAVLVTPALAGRSSSSVSLHPLSAPAATTSASPSDTVAFGSQVTFDVSTTATSYPWVETLCYQGRTLVYGATHGFFSSYFTAPVYTLGPTQLWSGGAATCTATLFSTTDGSKRKVLATTSFNVG